MVHRRFINSFGPSCGEDNRTDFLYDRRSYQALKELLNGIDIVIYRDGTAAEDGNLALLVKEAKTQENVKHAAEIIPVHGAIAYVESPWSASHKTNYKTYSYPNRFDVGIMQGQNIIHVLSIWYSQEGYIKANPGVQLNPEIAIKEIIS
jgi:hypothetical protein